MPDTYSLAVLYSGIPPNCEFWFQLSLLSYLFLLGTVFVPPSVNLMTSGPPPYCRGGLLYGPPVFFLLNMEFIFPFVATPQQEFRPFAMNRSENVRFAPSDFGGSSSEYQYAYNLISSSITSSKSLKCFLA